MNTVSCCNTHCDFTKISLHQTAYHFHYTQEDVDFKTTVVLVSNLLLIMLPDSKSIVVNNVMLLFISSVLGRVALQFTLLNISLLLTSYKHVLNFFSSVLIWQASVGHCHIQTPFMFHTLLIEHFGSQHPLQWSEQSQMELDLCLICCDTYATMSVLSCHFSYISIQVFSYIILIVIVFCVKHGQLSFTTSITSILTFAKESYTVGMGSVLLSQNIQY